MVEFAPLYLCIPSDQSIIGYPDTNHLGLIDNLANILSQRFDHIERLLKEDRDFFLAMLREVYGFRNLCQLDMLALEENFSWWVCLVSKKLRELLEGQKQDIRYYPHERYKVLWNVILVLEKHNIVL